MKFPSPYNAVLPDKIPCTKTPDFHKKDEIMDQIVGSLVGLAIGDALGASVEFRPQQFLAANPVSTMEGGGTWGLDAGKWTDDTSMALCLASSLITENGFNPYDQMVRYKWWHKYGYLSSTGNCFDIGSATRQSIEKFTARQKILKTHYRCRNEEEVDTLTFDSVERIESFNVDCGDLGAAGNGALMRLAPVPLFFFKTPTIAIEYAGRSALLTHAHKKAIDACRYYAALIIGALHGLKKDELLHKEFYLNHKEWFGEVPLHEDIMQISLGSYQKDKTKDGYEQGIRGKGYIVNALEAALWAFWSDGDSFRKGALTAVNLGDDTDTTAAIYGQLAGAYYGYKQIPKEWLQKLYARELLVCMGEWLHFQGNQRAVEDREQYHASTALRTAGNSKSSSHHKSFSASSTLPSDQSAAHQTNQMYNNNSDRDTDYPMNLVDLTDSNTNTSRPQVVSPSGVDTGIDNTHSYRRQISSINPRTNYVNGMEQKQFYRSTSTND